MFTHIESLIGSINHQRVIQQISFFQIIEYTPYVVIKRLHCLHIVAHIALELPVGKFFSLQVLFIEIIDNRSIKIIPCGTLFLIHSFKVIFIKRLQTRFLVRTQHFQIIEHIHILHNTHFLGRSSRTSFIVIKKIIRQREGFIFIKSQITGIRHPVTMNSLMMNQQTKRLLRVTLIFHPVNGIVSDKIGYVTMPLNGIIILRNKIRIIIMPLSGNNFPVIKAGGQAFKMPFSDQCGLITGFLQKLRESLL